MIQYPVKFTGRSIASSGMKTSWHTMASGHELNCSVPAEFEGDGTNPSPEDYFLLAIQNCFIATFKVFAEYSKLTFHEVSIQSELEVDRNPEGKITMKSMALNIQITGVSDEKKARLLVDKTLKTGFIIQSVKTEITPHVSILT
jgi:organic hydroperoxide reductase OsmC/OhrA